jgi:hypothetical protein
MTKRQEASSWAKLIGGGYAYVQHGMDKVIEWGFAKMRDVSEEPEKAAKADAEPGNPHIANAKRLGKKAMHFASSAVHAYYDTYRELKKKDNAA